MGLAEFTVRIDINVQEGLPDGLKDRIKRQIAFKLGPKSGTVESVRASLKTLNLADESLGYVCRISAKLKSGASHEAQMRGRHPNICIADTAARLSRAIVREAQLPGAGAQADVARR